MSGVRAALFHIDGDLTTIQNLISGVQKKSFAYYRPRQHTNVGFSMLDDHGYRRIVRQRFTGRPEVKMATYKGLGVSLSLRKACESAANVPFVKVFWRSKPLDERSCKIQYIRSF